MAMRKAAVASTAVFLARYAGDCAFAVSPGGSAQQLAATLSGVVTDASGAVIPHALVTITLNGVNGFARAVESDGNGNYVATNLSAGTYAVSVTAPGFETFKGKNIILNVAEKHAVNVQLKTGSASTTVIVDDNPVSIDTQAAPVGDHYGYSSARA